MPISWVTGTTAVFSSGTSFAATTPAGIQDNDGLFAFVMTRSTLTPPAGWTVVASEFADGAGTRQYLYLAKKTTVTAADSSTSVTWTQASSNRIGVTYAVIRGNGQKITVSQVLTTTASYTYDTSINLAVGTATAFEGEVFLGAATAISIYNPFTATPPTGMTLWTGGGNDHRLSAAYQEAALGESNSQTYFANNWGGENGMVGMLVRVRDAAIPAGWTDFAGFNDTYSQTQTVDDGLALTSPALGAKRQADAVAESVRASDALARQSVTLSAWSESAAVAEAHAIDRYAMAVLQEPLTIGSVLAGFAQHNSVLAESVKGREVYVTARTAGLIDSGTLTDSFIPYVGLTVLERIGVLPTVATFASQRPVLVEDVVIADELRRFMGAAAADSGIVTDALVRYLRARPVVTESVSMTDTTSWKLVLRVEADEDVVVDDVMALFWRARTAISDMVQLSGLLVTPSAFVTWAINTRTGATTNYTQYPYTSFARRGSRYLATAQDGLYELAGDTDNGTNIIAEIQSGFMQFAGSKFTSFKGIYLGMHGSGQVFLRLDTGDGKQYTYQVVAQDMETTKVRVGKGLRARYFSFALITTGQDFDLDTVEFLPIGAQRRV